jgi:GNAT superfamily N-acetyltransferase
MIDLPVVECQKDGFTISTDKSRLDVTAIYEYLTGDSYWSHGIPRCIVERSIQGALCFGVYQGEQQVGFARVITDASTFAYLLDVFILGPYRKRGLGKWLVETILAHPQLQTIRSWMLSTWDAQELYARYGFTPLEHPEYMMTRRDPQVFLRSSDEE